MKRAEKGREKWRIWFETVGPTAVLTVVTASAFALKGCRFETVGDL